MKKNNLLRLVMTAVMCAAVCIMTLIVQIPIPLTGGYINLGDGTVILSGIILGPIYGAVASGIGSSLADILSGYVIYAPATAAIKIIMALFVGMMLKNKTKEKPLKVIVVSFTAEIIMVAGYFLFEAFSLGFGIAATMAVPQNLIQGAMGCVFTVIMLPVLKRIKKTEGM